MSLDILELSLLLLHTHTHNHMHTHPHTHTPHTVRLQLLRMYSCALDPLLRKATEYATT